MNDTFYELLVARKQRAVDTFIRILTIAVVVILILATPIAGFISTLLGIVLGFAAYYFILPRLRIEYEYSILNRDMQIDIIYNKLKRKKLLTIDLKEVEVAAPLGSHRLDSIHPSKTIDCSSGDSSKRPYALVLPMNQATTCIYIQPDEHMLKLLEQWMPRTLSRD